MGDFDKLIVNRYSVGKGFMLKLYKFLSCKWYANNVDALMKNEKCYKIHTFDQNDDVVDVFSSTHHGISAKCSSIDYNDSNWFKFYKSLNFLYEIENELFSIIENDEDDIKIIER